MEQREGERPRVRAPKVRARGAIVRRGRVRVRRSEDPEAVLAWAVAQRVRAARERAGMNQGGLAERAEIARPNVACFESGLHLASVSTLRRAAETRGLELAALAAVPVARASREDRELDEAGLGSLARALDAADKRRRRRARSAASSGA